MQVNIGLDTNIGGTLTVQHVLGTLSKHGISVSYFAVRDSNTEGTFCAEIDAPIDNKPSIFYDVAQELQQDCIAVKCTNGEGDLIGPSLQVTTL